jgi:phage gp36-like protein
LYCTIDDILKYHSEATLIQLSDDTDAQAEINETVVNGAISDAAEFIDGFLRSRYALPFAAAPKLLLKLAVDISIYYLYQRRVGEMPKTIDDAYKNAVKALEKIQKGLLQIGAEETSGRTPGEFRVNKTAEDRIFSKDVLKLF